MVAIEIEKKFLINKDALKSTSLNILRKLLIEQIYISNEELEIRLRNIKTNDSENSYLTIKSNGYLQREEIEFKISNEDYKKVKLSKLYKGQVIRKNRYEVLLDLGFIAELDVYKEQLNGLVVVEVEFNNTEQINEFIKPNWFAEDITFNKKYKNKNLSKKLSFNDL